MRKKIVWSLFDSETATVAKALRDCDVYSFGIGSGSGHVHLDLSDFVVAKKTLDKYPKPDYIFASPPCESWSFVSVGNKRNFTRDPGLNLFWRKKWVPFDFLPRHFVRRMNGVKTAETLANIIRWYSPEYWAIENGTRSLLFDYLREICHFYGFKNLINYYSYGFEYLKPTTIYSNAKLLLKKESSSCELVKIETHIKNFSKIDLARYRSRVPESLYLDIFSQFDRGFLL